jgi:hypothetical protein
MCAKRPRSASADSRRHVGLLKNHLTYKVASTKLFEPISRRFVAIIEQFVRDHAVAMICFGKGNATMKWPRLRASFLKEEAVNFVVKAQDKCTVYRTERRRKPRPAEAMPGS